MTLDVVDLTCELCAIPSVTGDEAAVVAEVAALLRRLGLHVRLQQVGEPTGRCNVLAVVDPDRAPDVLLTTHIDTVPPFFAPILIGDKDTGTLQGRGVIDAKGIAAAMICAFQRFLPTPDVAARVGLMFVVGEETTSDGAKAAVREGFVPPVRYFIDGEPTDGLLCRAMKGVLAFELSAEGKAAHSAYPQAGHSAVHQLIDDLGRLRAEAWPTTEFGETTLNVGVFEGGVAPNVLAPAARARLMMRPTADPDSILARIQALLTPGTRLDVKSKAWPVRLHTPAGEDTCIVAFGSDVPHLAPALHARQGSPLLVGPGSILDAHTDHERVHVKDLRAAVDTYERLTLRLLESIP